MHAGKWCAVSGAGQSTAFSADAACHGPQSDADAQHARNHCLSIEDASLIRGTVQQIACGSHAQRRGALQRFAPAPPRKPVLQVPRKKRYTSRKIGRMIGLRLVVS